MGRRSHKVVQTVIPQLDGDFNYISEAQRSLLWRTAKQNGWEADDVKAAIASVQGISFDAASVKVLLSRHFNAVLEKLSAPAIKPKPIKQLNLL